MLAVIELGGNQFIVQKGDIIEVKKQDIEVGKILSVEALLVSDIEGKDTKVGTPLVEGSKVECKVLDQKKGEKVRVFKMKSKKRFKRNKGFRPSITQLEIMSIS
ncbi:50S ribosomal protein L21 [Candidatus Gracilibacteria bacterium]|nr:50S ribosomal protein L21 [Candidatus Gracilibacteria bacterium]